MCSSNSEANWTLFADIVEKLKLLRSSISLLKKPISKRSHAKADSFFSAGYKEYQNCLQNNYITTFGRIT